MRAAILSHFGPPEAFAIGEVETPTPEGDEVLIRVGYAGVGGWDAEIRAGEWGDQGPFPLVPGTDGFGVVEAAGPDAVFRVGERVWAYGIGGKKGGFYAEFACVPSANVAHAPPRISDAEAGGAPIVALTAWTGVRSELVVEPTDVVLVHGATAAVGICAVQFAAWTGARVLVTASHDAQALRELGAAEVFDVRTSDGKTALRSEAKNVTKLLAAAPWPADLADLLAGIIVAYPNGVEPPAGASDARAFDGVPDRALWDALDGAVRAHRFELPIAATFPLARIADAHAAVAKPGRFGKIVIAIDRAV